MIGFSELDLAMADHEKAFTEVSFLLDVLTRTAKEMVGNAGPLGTTAGRLMGKKLPVRLIHPTFEEGMAVVQEKLKAGFDIKSRCDEGGVEMEVGRCAIRDVCKERQLALGGDLCTTFHYYLAGMAAELLGKRSRAVDTVAQESSCTFRLEIK